MGRVLLIIIFAGIISQPALGGSDSRPRLEKPIAGIFRAMTQTNNLHVFLKKLRLHTGPALYKKFLAKAKGLKQPYYRARRYSTNEVRIKYKEKWLPFRVNLKTGKIHFANKTLPHPITAENFQDVFNRVNKWIKQEDKSARASFIFFDEADAAAGLAIVVGLAVIGGGVWAYDEFTDEWLETGIELCHKANEQRGGAKQTTIVRAKNNLGWLESLSPQKAQKLRRCLEKSDLDWLREGKSSDTVS